MPSSQEDDPLPILPMASQKPRWRLKHLWNAAPVMVSVVALVASVLIGIRADQTARRANDLAGKANETAQRALVQGRYEDAAKVLLVVTNSEVAVENRSSQLIDRVWVEDRNHDPSQ